MKSRLFWLYCGLAAFSILGTFFSRKFQIDPGMIAPISGFLFTMTGAMVIALSLKDWKPCLLLLVICGLSEVVGLFTGFPFGRYEYTNWWWPTIALSEGHFFPILLPFAWLMIVGGSYLASRNFLDKNWSVLSSALTATMIDAPMELAMTRIFGYWTWKDKGPVFGAPTQNSIGWFAVSLVAALILRTFDRDVDPQHAGRVVGIFCFFVAFAGFMKFGDIAWILLLAASVCFFMAERVANSAKSRP
jgi:uncharacterized membrane protein